MVALIIFNNLVNDGNILINNISIMENLITLWTIIQYNVIYLIIWFILFLFIYRDKLIFTYYYSLLVISFCIFLIWIISIINYFYNFSWYEFWGILMMLYWLWIIFIILFIFFLLYDLWNDRIFKMKSNRFNNFLFILSISFVLIFSSKLIYHMINSEKITSLWYWYYVQWNSAYFTKTYIQWSDWKTFNILDGYLAKDDKNIYFYWDKVIWVDIETFSYLGWWYFKDKYNFYYQNKIMDDVDENTFIYLWDKKAKDKNSLYYNWNTVKD